MSSIPYILEERPDTGMNNSKKPTELTGHSIMMGYLDDKLNEKVFKNESMKII